MKGFRVTSLTNLALGEAVPCRPGGTTAKAYKRSKGANDVSCTAHALQKEFTALFRKCRVRHQWPATAPPPPLPQLKKLWHHAMVGFRNSRQSISASKTSRFFWKVHKRVAKNVTYTASVLQKQF